MYFKRLSFLYFLHLNVFFHTPQYLLHKEAQTFFLKCTWRMSVYRKLIYLNVVKQILLTLNAIQRHAHDFHIQKGYKTVIYLIVLCTYRVLQTVDVFSAFADKIVVQIYFTLLRTTTL